MAIYVLLHAAWAGGWQWRQVATRLQQAGHEVLRPTFTGLGERAHLATAETNLQLHIQDIMGLFAYEELSDVILVGHSYAGMVITAVAERVPERIAHLVYVDAFVPQHGQSLGDIIGPELRHYFTRIAERYGDGWRVPHDRPGSPPSSKRTDQPLKTMMDIVEVNNPATLRILRTYIACTQKSVDWPFTPILVQTATYVRAKGWRYRELPTNHYPMETMPQELTSLLLEISCCEGQRSVPAVNK